MAASSACSGEDEDDPVVREIDVYLCKQLTEQLYLLQYPLKAAGIKMTHSDVVTGRIKPLQHKVELEVSLDTQSSSYCRSRGEQIAVNVDGVTTTTDTTTTQSGSGPMFPCGMMDRQVLTSTTVPGSVCSYHAVGIFIDDELHITPLHSIIQMKPSFTYLDKADKKSKAREAAQGNDTGESSQDEEPDLKPVTVKFARRDTERSRDIRMRSFAYLQEKRNEEQWLPLKHHTARATSSGLERNSLLCPSQEDSMSESINLDKTEQQYLDLLVPETTDMNLDKPTLPNNVISLTQLRTQPLGDQIRTLMVNSKLMQFQTLHSLVGNRVDISAVLKSIQQYAVLVRGCWVVKSEILYPKDTFSPNTGIPSDLLCKGRDYIMWKFNNNRYMLRSEVSGVVRLPSDDLKDIMQQMSRMKVGLGWEFSLETDDDFIDRHPDVVERQGMVWRAKFEQLCKVLKIPKSESPDRKNKSSVKEVTVSGSERVKVATAKARARANRLRKEIGAGDTAPLSSETTTVKQESMDTSETEGGVPTVRENGSIPNQKQKHSLLSEEEEDGTEQCNNYRTPEKSEQFHKQLSDFLSASFKTHTVLNITEMRRLLVLHLAHSSPGSTLVEHITDSYFEKTSVELGAVRITVPWTSKTPVVADGKVYVLSCKGDLLQKHRDCVLDCFKESVKLAKGRVVKRLEESLGPMKKDTLCQVLTEMCTQRGSFLSIKHTVTQS